MKKYLYPELKIVYFSREKVVTISGEGTDLSGTMNNWQAENGKSAYVRNITNKLTAVVEFEF